MWRELFCVVALAGVLGAPSAGLAGPVLGTAQDFAVLGYAGVTNTGSTTIYGNVGVYPGAITLITGFPPGAVTGGTIHGPDGVSQQALADVTNAYGVLAGLPFTSDLTGSILGNGVGGTVSTLSPGVYNFDTTAQLNGTLTLDAQNDPSARFVFQIGSMLTTASASAVNVINGGPNNEVYWLTGSAATLGSSTVFTGNILAYAGISLDSTAQILCGRAFSQTASVTLISNVISNNNTAEDFGSGRSDFGSYGFSGGTNGSTPVVPVPGAFLLVCCGTGSMCAFGRRLFSRS